MGRRRDDRRRHIITAIGHDLIDWSGWNGTLSGYWFLLQEEKEKATERPTREAAEAAVTAFLLEHYPDRVQEWRRQVYAGATDLAHDGDDGWSFSADDSVGYVKPADDGGCQVEGLY